MSRRHRPRRWSPKSERRRDFRQSPSSEPYPPIRQPSSLPMSFSKRDYSDTIKVSVSVTTRRVQNQTVRSGSRWYVSAGEELVTQLHNDVTRIATLSICIFFIQSSQHEILSRATGFWQQLHIVTASAVKIIIDNNLTANIWAFEERLLSFRSFRTSSCYSNVLLSKQLQRRRQTTANLVIVCLSNRKNAVIILLSHHAMPHRK